MKLAYRIIIPVIVVMALSVFVVDGFFRISTEESVLREEFLESQAVILQNVDFFSGGNVFADPFASSSQATFAEFDRRVRVPSVARLTVWNKDHMVIYSDLKSIIGDRSPRNADLTRLFAQKSSFFVRKASDTNRPVQTDVGEIIDIYVPVTVSGDMAAGVEIQMVGQAALGIIRQNFMSVQLLLVAITVANFIFIFLIFYAFILSPIKSLSAAARAMRKGDVNTAVTYRSGDEMGALAADFDSMRRSLRDSLARFRASNDELRRFELAVEYSSNHIIFTDPEGVIIYANKAAEVTTGYSKLEMIGKRPSLWGNQMGREFYKDLWRTIKDEKKMFTGIMNNLRKGGTPYIAESSIVPIVDENGTIRFFVGIERDVTRERELDRAKSDFISIASHQLRTPLTGIQWVVERFTKKEKLTPKGKEYLEDIHMSAKRLTQLVDLLLNLSRIEGGRVTVTPEPVEAVGFVRSYLDECAPLFEKKKLELVFTEHPAELTAVTDKSSLRNIVQSLVSNAIEYTLPGGTVEVAIKKESGTFTMQVRDTGVGIPKAEQSHIFEKFMRASNAKLYKTDGTGIGLYIAERATKLLGGKIWFESEENKGSTFHVELPLETKAPQPPHENGEA